MQTTVAGFGNPTTWIKKEYMCVLETGERAVPRHFSLTSLKCGDAVLFFFSDPEKLESRKALLKCRCATGREPLRCGCRYSSSFLWCRAWNPPPCEHIDRVKPFLIIPRIQNHHKTPPSSPGKSSSYSQESPGFGDSKWGHKPEIETLSHRLVCMEHGQRTGREN